MKPRLLVLACFIVLMSTLVIRASQSPESAVEPEQPTTRGPVAGQPSFDCGGEPCHAVLRGLLAFGDRRLRGLGANGRACADCHMPIDHFQLSPASAEARFQFLQLRRRFNPKADDPLFRPIDADDFRTNGDGASDFSNLRQNGLIRIVFTLPSNVRLIVPGTTDVSSETVADVWRSVPTVNDVALTGPDGSDPVWARDPNRTGGYQLDARIGSLQQQALGAFVNHAQAQNAVPQELLDDLSSFQRVLFTNNRVRALSDALRSGHHSVAGPGSDRSTRSSSKARSSSCERAASATAVPDNRLRSLRSFVFTISRPSVRVPSIPSAPLASPSRRARTVSRGMRGPTRSHSRTVPRFVARARIPGRALTTGVAGFGLPAPQDDWNKFDATGLRGIRNTAPYFHNNSADTLEEVVDHYIEFFKRVKANTAPGAPIPPIATTDGINFDRQPLPEERTALLAYLRKL